MAQVSSALMPCPEADSETALQVRPSKRFTKVAPSLLAKIEPSVQATQGVPASSIARLALDTGSGPSLMAVYSVSPYPVHRRPSQRRTKSWPGAANPTPGTVHASAGFLSGSSASDDCDAMPPLTLTPPPVADPPSSSQAPQSL